MVVLPAFVVSKILRALSGEGSLSFAIDDEAREHGAIALMGTIGCIWGLRPDGTLWQFDADVQLPLSPLPPELTFLALIAGSQRYAWLAPLVPARPDVAIDCPVCPGPKNPMLPVFCAICSGLGWVTG